MTPSFWASDAPLALIRARIHPDPALSYDERRLNVSPGVFDKLQQSALRRTIYASIRLDDSDCRPCVVPIFLSKGNVSDDSALEDALPVCSVSPATWFALASSHSANSTPLANDAANLSVVAAIEAIEPVALTEVVLGVSESQYSAALAAQDQIAAHVKSQTRLLYRDYTIEVSVTTPSDSASSIVLQCLMCQPVSQGLLRLGSEARIVIAKSPSVAGLRLPALGPSSTLDSDADSEEWDLGAEWFILGDTPFGSGRDVLSGAAFGSLKVAGSHEVESASSDLLPRTKGQGKELNVITLTSPIDNFSLVPGACAGEDLDNRGYMSIASLARAGIFSGSWVQLEPVASQKPGAEPSFSGNQRAIRVFGSDDITALDTLALPPVLFSNICYDGFSSGASHALASLPEPTVRIVLTPLGLPPKRPSPSYVKRMASLDGSAPPAAYQPALEIAKKVFIARVSSPLTEKRDLEPYVLAALQGWLSPPPPPVLNKSGEKPLRVVKANDLIAVHVPLGETDVRLGVAQAIAADTEADASLVDIDPASDIIIDGSLARHQWAQPESSSEYAFYRVVKVEGFRGGRQSGSHSSSSDSDSEDEDDSERECESDYKFIEGDDSSDPLDQEWMLWYHQVHNKGFVVRPDVTMVVQSGAVHGYVPYRPVCAYEGAGKNRRNVASASIPENMAYSGILKQLLCLASTSLHPLALSHGLTCAALLKGSSGTGKRYLVRAVAEQLGVHLYELNCYDVLSESEDKAAQVLHVYFENASRYTPCVLHLRSIEALAETASTQQNQDAAEDLPIARVLKKCLADINMAHRDTGFPIIVIASSGQPDKVPTSLAAVFHHEIQLPVPDERTRLALLTSITERSLLLAPDTDIAYVAQQTASFVARDLVTLVRRAERRAWERVRALATTDTQNQALRTRDLQLSGQMITREDLLGALGDARASMSDALGVPKIPNVKWDDVGGLADAKKDILDTIRLPMEQPHLFANGLTTRSGLLFYGPPGTGKTLLAKAIATECGLNFFSCKGPELISPYIGESEANVRRIFQRAREASPCVIFFDELDSLAPKRGQQGDSGGVMDRIVSQLLAELDGMSGGSGGSSSSSDGDKTGSANDVSNEAGGSGKAAAVQVFAIGATNRPDLLDPALLRPGRFDKLVYLGVSETHDAQLNIIQALTRKFHLHPNLDLRSIAEQCPFHYTGADFYALCSDALLKAMLRTVDEVDLLVKEWNDRADGALPQSPEKTGGGEAAQMYLPVPMTPQYYLDHIAPDSVKQVTVTASDFETALDELIPSVSADELVRYQVLRHQFDSVLKGKARSESATGGEGASRQPLLADDRVSPPDTFAEGSSTHQISAKSKGKGKEPDI
ncbi:peroxisomal assembly protein [Coemansia spiralis]|uniref:Peroxisomal ATPase PEX6 n=1 Tax=Coemansia spiralis TaxID=417178 RepID=A0A9W8GQ29_9FUNG|nr:peroxisomal assembly protein [Coemansia spiralis]